MRPPEAATGWPMLQPLPEILTLSSLIPSPLHAAIGTDANASLISHNAMSDNATPARDRSLGTTSSTAIPVRRGSMPIAVQARTFASGDNPSLLEKSSVVIARADAASFTPLELPPEIGRASRRESVCQYV